MNWTRIKNDTPLLFSLGDDADVIGVLQHTYGVKILEDCGELYYVFSPDFNRNGYVLKEDVIETHL